MNKRFTKVTNYIKDHQTLFLLSLLFLLIRLPLLNQLSLLNDELDINLSGYFISQTGKDFTGNSFPLYFTSLYSASNPFVAIYYSAFWYLIIPIKSVFMARLPYVLISTSLVFLIYELIRTITKNKRLSLLTSIIFCFSPWIFHISRLALEINIALPFLLLGIILFLKDKQFFSYVCFFIAFFGYQGFRPLIPFLLIYLAFFRPYLAHKKFEIKRFFPSIGIIILFVAVLFGIGYAIDGQFTKTRSSKTIIFFDKEKLAKDVILKRNTSIAPKALQSIIHNKISSSIDYTIDNFLEGLSPLYLFKKGDSSAIYGNVSTGQFFTPFILLFLLGIIALSKVSKKEYLFVTGFIFIGLIPSIINSQGTTFSIRASLSAVGFAFLIAVGFEYGKILLNQLPTFLKTTLVFIFLSFVVINSVYFVYNYFERRPLMVGEYFNEKERKVSQYLKNTDKPFLIYHDSPRILFLNLVFFNTFNKDEISTIQKKLKAQDDFVLENKKIILCKDITTKQILKFKDIIIKSSCLPESESSNFEKTQLIKKIPFSDTTLRSSYFIFE